MSSKGLAQKKLLTVADYAKLLEEPAEIVVDMPRRFVSRIRLNRPDSKNRMGHVMRAQLLNQLQLNDQDPDVRVTIVCGAGEDFCAGLDVARSRGTMPFFTDETDGQLMRNMVQTWFQIMDLAKPVIAQVHGDCLGSGMELAAACDIVYTAEDARIGYPEGRNMGLPDLQIYPWLCGMRNALSIMLLAETMDGPTAVVRGFATRSFPLEQLEERTLEMAERVARIPADLLAYNKRSVYRAFEAQGMRASLRHGVDLEALMFHSSSGNILTRAAAQGGATVRPGPSAQSAGRQAPKPNIAGKEKNANTVMRPKEMVHKTEAVLEVTETKQTENQLDIQPLVADDDEAEHLVPLQEARQGKGVQLHLHEAVNIHIHQIDPDEEDIEEPTSKL